MVATGLGTPPTEHKLLPQFRAGARNGRPWLWTCDEEFWRGVPGVLWGLERRAGCGDVFECVPARPGVNSGSVVFKEREQVIIAVCGEVRWAQVGQQLIRVGQFWEQIQCWFWGLPCPRHAGGPHHACGRIEGQLTNRP